MMKILYMAAAVVATALTMALHAQNAQTSETDANGVPLFLYPPGFFDTAQPSGSETKSLANSTAVPLNPLGMQPMDQQQSTPPTYVVVDLGTLGGNGSSATGINAAGQVVGAAYTSSGNTHAFLWTNAPMQDIGTLGGNSSGASGINSAGQVVGYANNTSGNARAFLWQNGGPMQDLGAWANDSLATSINDNGQIVGESFTNGGPIVYVACLWQNGSMQGLGTFGGISSTANGINSAGQIVGDSRNSSFIDRAFLWQNGGPMQDLGSLGGSSSVAYGINSVGQIVGDASINGTSYHAFLWQNPGPMQDLGTLGGNDSVANGINSAGQIVGYANTSGGNNHAFLWQNGTMYDLTNLLFSQNWGWTLPTAAGINDSEEIVGSGINPAGQTNAFLLVPFTGFHQGDGPPAVAPEFGYDNAIQFALPGTQGNYSGGKAVTVHYGCALCSLASMLTSVHGYESMTPVQLDGALKLRGLQFRILGNDENSRTCSGTISYSHGQPFTLG